MNRELRPWDTYHTKGIKAKFLYRYVDEKKLIHFLETKSLYLTKMQRFDDQLEGISTFDITELRHAYHTCFIAKEEEIRPELLTEWRELKKRDRKGLESIASKLEQTQNAHFVSCWFNSGNESHGMWSYYADGNGFAIKIGRSEFQDKIEKSVSRNIECTKHGIVAGRINYQDFPRIIEKEQENQVKYLAFRKDESFSHEKEYRIVFIDLTDKAFKQDHKLYSIEKFEKLKITIITHPKIDDDEFEIFKLKFQRYGTNISVVKSELEPFYKLRDRILNTKP